ncbi:uncharacterized protein LOC126456894 [Schistocerca serialis cubense]|uniref:uncharacterized protein LOC126456894 n=1 Tax=Schistocerca serialis cubense TaxID=2023355 RepID=UPI00214E8DE1|nr:uncharacterized protein LOC126456894 [Schistocerca serialis cubense]
MRAPSLQQSTESAVKTRAGVIPPPAAASAPCGLGLCSSQQSQQSKRVQESCPHQQPRRHHAGSVSAAVSRVSSQNTCRSHTPTSSRIGTMRAPSAAVSRVSSQNTCSRRTPTSSRVSTMRAPSLQQSTESAVKTCAGVNPHQQPRRHHAGSVTAAVSRLSSQNMCRSHTPTSSRVGTMRALSLQQSTESYPHQQPRWHHAGSVSAAVSRVSSQNTCSKRTPHQQPRRHHAGSVSAAVSRVSSQNTCRSCTPTSSSVGTMRAPSLQQSTESAVKTRAGVVPPPAAASAPCGLPLCSSQQSQQSKHVQQAHPHQQPRRHHAGSVSAAVSRVSSQNTCTSRTPTSSRVGTMQAPSLQQSAESAVKTRAAGAPPPAAASAPCGLRLCSSQQSQQSKHV